MQYRSIARYRRTHDRLPVCRGIRCAWAWSGPGFCPSPRLSQPRSGVLHGWRRTVQGAGVLSCLDIADEDGALAVDGLNYALDVLLEGAVLSLHYYLL